MSRKNSDKIILDLCGGTGAWSKPYKDAGYLVIVVTLPEYDIMKSYFAIRNKTRYWVFPRTGNRNTWVPLGLVYGILAAPVCTYFSRARSNAKTPRDLEDGMKLVRKCMDVIWTVQEVLGMPTLKFWALENPMGVLRRFLGRPKFSFDPCDYSDPWTKKTDIWGWFKEPRKRPVEPILGSRIHLMAPSEDRTMKRSITPPGFSKAFFEANK